MHKEAWDFVEGVKAKFPEAFKGKRVLEVGSRYINGTVRTLFDGCDYTGLDLSPGPCVDMDYHVVAFKQCVWEPLEHEPYGTIISCEALEHDKHWAESIRAMWDMLDNGGTLIITAGGTGRPEHGTTRTSPADSPATTDYYGNITKEMFWEVFNPWPDKPSFRDFFIEDKDGDFRFWGLKA